MVTGMAGGPQAATSRFARGLMDLLDRVEYRPARYAEDFEAVYRLRYHAYRREGFIPENAERICKDDLDDQPNCRIVGVYLDGQLVSSLRVHHVTTEHRHSASMTVYSDLLDPMVDRGVEFVDPSRFTADYDASLEYPALPFLTLRIAAMASVYYDADYCLAIVRPEHAAFYKRVFLSQEWAEQRSYDGLAFPVCLYAAEVPVIRDQVYSRFPFFMSTQTEQRMMFGRGDRHEAAMTVRPTARFAYAEGVRRAAIA